MAITTNSYEAGSNIGQVRYTATTDMNYWDEKKGKYAIWLNRGAQRLWADVDYIELMDNNLLDCGRLLAIMHAINKDNMLTKWDKKTRHNVPLASTAELMELVQIGNRGTFRKFWDRIEKKDIVKEIKIPSLTEKGKSYSRYYVNPLLTLADKGITIANYLLFKESLDPFLTTLAKENLMALADAEFGTQKEEEVAQEVAPDMTLEVVQEEAEEAPEEQQTDEFKEHILQDVIYEGKQPQFYSIGKYGAQRAEYTDSTDMYVQFNCLTGIAGKNSQAKAEEVNTYNVWFADIDAGKDADGHYLSDEEVAKRKAHMLDIIHKLPLSTYINETRNGFHVLWKTYGVNSFEEWNKVQQKIMSVLAVTDKGVKDPGRLLRVPNSMWSKANNKAAAGISAFRCRCAEAHDQAWDIMSIMSQLDACETEVHELCAAYMKEFGIEEKKPVASNKAATTRKASSQPSAVVNTLRTMAISNLNTTSFAIPATTTYVDNVAYAVNHNVDMAGLLDLSISNGQSFCDIFHAEKHPSANIYSNTDGSQQYVCASGPMAGRSLSNIDLVMELAHCDARKAIRFLAQVANIKQRRGAKVA
ncbi:hypothetical protein SELR_pSRC500090 (plasmid) [Selenomonas ruminantium subsp. lactilytica TAM6421]|uniref:Uncharacterized protein n=1 Tax=Selenomonas ruminantium subsp. lactilytica (strain NBRC 103574 / TAM6421) TaxID=927704 RepID=I0GWP6_SELRL|nr:hypothetical protein [Selenomonas ruminantium]BAL85183.1 hypothetical protein SELR_pSRC500090 [Selenomonas ruminantium subsp. lactilytica TAM6421]